MPGIVVSTLLLVVTFGVTPWQRTRHQLVPMRYRLPVVATKVRSVATNGFPQSTAANPPIVMALSPTYSSGQNERLCNSMGTGADAEVTSILVCLHLLDSTAVVIAPIPPTSALPTRAMIAMRSVRGFRENGIVVVTIRKRVQFRTQ